LAMPPSWGAATDMRGRLRANQMQF